jgi:uncharacterized Zn finger protein
MNIKKTNEGYEAESSSSKGKWYKVDPSKPWCDCPGYKFRAMKTKGVCKHIEAVREFIAKNEQKTVKKEQKKNDDMMSFIDKQGGEADSLEIIGKFGEEKVDSMIKRGELIERSGKITILK